MCDCRHEASCDSCKQIKRLTHRDMVDGCTPNLLATSAWLLPSRNTSLTALNLAFSLSFDLQQQFVELRAKGNSFDNIAKKLKESKR